MAIPTSRRIVVIAGLTTLGLVTSSAAALATVTTSNNVVSVATALAAPGMVTGAAQAITYPCAPDDPLTVEVDPGPCPTAVSDSLLAGFPTEGATYAILTTGDAALADDPNGAANTGESLGTTNPAMGASVFDWNTYRIDLPPAGTSCLAFDFKFLSDEFPEFVNSSYNDAFIAQLGAPAVTIDPTGAINAPGNFAAGAGDMISVNASGPSATSAEAAAGTTYDGATTTLTARTPVTPGATNSLFLTLFDQGDSAYDSAVFVDNLRYDTVAAAKCKSLALDPFEGTTGITLTQGAAPTLAPNLSSLSVPVDCALPPGSFSCTVSATAGFNATVGKSFVNRVATVPLATGSGTIPADTSGVLVLPTTPEGIAAVKDAISGPKKLKKKAKKATKKAKKLKKKAATIKGTPKAKKLLKQAKKLTKKAAKLRKRARILAKKPLGTVTIVITNPSNNTSSTITASLSRP